MASEENGLSKLLLPMFKGRGLPAQPVQAESRASSPGVLEESGSFSPQGNSLQEGMLWKLASGLDVKAEFEHMANFLAPGKLSDWRSWRRRRFVMSMSTGVDGQLGLNYLSGAQYGRALRCAVLLGSGESRVPAELFEMPPIVMLVPDEQALADLYAYDVAIGVENAPGDNSPTSPMKRTKSIEDRLDRYTRECPKTLYPCILSWTDPKKRTQTMVFALPSSKERTIWVKAMRLHIGQAVRRGSASKSPPRSPVVGPSSPSGGQFGRTDSHSNRNRNPAARGAVPPTSHTKFTRAGTMTEDHNPLDPWRGKRPKDSPVKIQKTASVRLRSLAVMSKAAMNFKKNSDKRCPLHDQLLMEQELVKLPMFQSCDPAAISAIAEVSRTHSYHPDAEVVRDGSSRNSMFIVMRGRLNMLVANMEVETIGPGEYVGETMVIGTESKWNLSLIASQASTVCEVTRQALYEVLQNFPTELDCFNAIRDQHQTDECLHAGTLVNPCSIFQGLRDETLQAIDQRMVTHVYFPGQTILEEGVESDRLFVLVKGDISKTVTGREVCKSSSEAHTTPSSPKTPVARRYSGLKNKRNSLSDHLGSPSDSNSESEDDSAPHACCFGEFCLLGIRHASDASLIAESVCHVRMIHRVTFVHILETYGEPLKNMAKALGNLLQEEEVMVGRALHEAKLFKDFGFHNQFVDFLAGHLEGRIFLKGSSLTDEGDRCMHVLLQGRVKIFKEGVEVAVVTNGAVIGEITALGLKSRRTATCIAEETCFTQMLHQCVIVHALEVFPDERRKVLRMVMGQDIDQGLSSHFQAPNEEIEVAAVLKKTAFFSSLAPSFVDELSEVAHDRIYMPGDLIMEKGRLGSSMFIVVSGSAGVYSNSNEAYDECAFVDTQRMTADALPQFDHRSWTKVGMLKEGSICGELAMLGITQVRGATIEAETICFMWEITQEDALAILEHFPSAKRHLAQYTIAHLDRTVSTRMLSLPLFHRFDKKFKTLLGLYCERQVDFPGHTIVHEGRKDDRLYVINMGFAWLEKKGMPVKTLLPGTHFGTTVMLGIDKWHPASFVARAMCHILTVSRSTYLLALEQYPSPAQNMALKIQEKQAQQQLVQGAKRAWMKRALWRKYNALIMSGTETSQTELLTQVMHAWHQRVLDEHDNQDRKESQQFQYDAMMERWWERHLQDQELLNHKKHMGEVLKHNTSRECQPLFPKVKGSNVRFWMGQVPAAVHAVPPVATAQRSSVVASRCSSAAPVSPLPPPHSARSRPPSQQRSASACGSSSLSARTGPTAPQACGAAATPCTNLVQNVMWSARRASPSSF